MVIYEPDKTELNSYVGGQDLLTKPFKFSDSLKGVYQQTTSGLSDTNQGCYELSGDRCYSLYAFEYKPG